MSLFSSIFSNVPLVAGGVAFLISQTLKVILYYFKDGELDFWHFCEAAGMPSTHSAMATAMTLSVGIIEGFASPIFALALVFSIIVMYDAMGVRFAAGQQALILNKIIEDIYSERGGEKEKLKELIGHTPSEVLGGFVLGLLVALVMYFLVY
ncbi:MAG: divergent PAP2 family protein [Candidatus Saganbacteria bacterium]|nr:divergent PAP2 family protein [Candidatus Saganbacteria bacterium]